MKLFGTKSSTEGCPHFSRNILLSAVAQQGEANKALELFQQMQRQGITPDVVTWYTCLFIHLQKDHSHFGLCETGEVRRNFEALS